MGKLQQIDIIGGFYADPDREWSVQDTCNWLPTVSEKTGTLTRYKLDTPPGLTLAWNLGDDPCRCLYVAEGALFAIHGTTLRQLVNGSWVTRGSVPGALRVEAAHNGRQAGIQVRFDNGQYGGGYVWDMQAQTLTRITDTGYPGSVSNDYIDHYLTGVDPAGRFWFISDLDNAMEYNTLDRTDSEASPDRIIAAKRIEFDIAVFNTSTTEFFYNAGTATGTFQSKRAVIDVGAAGRFTIQRIDNTLIFLGSDGILYRINGYQKQRISTVPFEKAIAGLRWSDAISFTHVDRGHALYFLHFPDGQTWCYDCASQEMSRRESIGSERWRVSHIVRWNGDFYAASLFDGRIWKLDWDSVREEDELFRSYRRTQIIHDSGNAFRVQEVVAQVQVGSKPDDWPDDLDHELMLRYSQDGGNNWSNWKRKTMGKLGEFMTRVRYLGGFGLIRKHVTIELSCASPRKRDLLGASATLDPT